MEFFPNGAELSLNSLNSEKVLLHLGKTPLNLNKPLKHELGSI